MPKDGAADRPRPQAMNNLELMVHVSMVHGALGAIRDLVIPNEGTGKNPDGSDECLDIVSRNGFVNLLEIIHDRLPPWQLKWLWKRKAQGEIYHVIPPESAPERSAH